MSSAAPPPPPVAAEVFGDRLALAERYAALLATEGVARGLIGPKEAPRLWPRHLLNSTVLAEWVPAAARVVDIGAGAGLPGIPLLLVRPDITMALCEPMLRRVRFLEIACAELAASCQIIRGRAEQLPAAAYDVAVVRAVAPLDQLLVLARPALASDGLLLALKGRNVATEVAAARASPFGAGAEIDVFSREIAGETTHAVRIRWPGSHASGRHGRATRPGRR